MRSSAQSPETARFDRMRTVPVVVLAGSTVLSAVFELPWAINAVTVLGVGGWLLARRHVRVHWVMFSALLAAVACVLSLQFGELGAQATRWVNLALAFIFGTMFLSSLWSLFGAGVQANRELDRIRGAVDRTLRR